MHENEISTKKLELIKRNIGNLQDYIDRICGLRQEQYEIKKEEWTLKRKQIDQILERESYFLFIGRFSSGKSSFINALLGKDLLPTASHPCTAVVTEISFVDSNTSNGNYQNGEIVYKSGEKVLKGRTELLDIIQGKTNIETGSIHHISIKLDINEFDEQVADVYRAFVDKIVLVDCPGFDSPYRFSESVLYEYIEKSSFTFYLLPANDFGGLNEVKRLTNLKKRTATLIPLISKSDLIADDEAKEEIAEEFEKILGNKFENQEPIFISTYKYNDLCTLQKSNADKIYTGTLSIEESETLNKLQIECGINRVFEQMNSKSDVSVLNEKKLESVLFDFNSIVDELRKASVNEINYWNKQLENLHVDITSKAYTDIAEYDKNINSYIRDEAARVGTEIKNKIVVDVATCLMRSGNRADSQALESIFKEDVKFIIDQYRPIWEKRIKEHFVVQAINIAEITEEAPHFPTDIPLSYVPMGIIEGLSKSGIDSIFTAIAGGSMLALQPAIASLSVPLIGCIGASLAPIAFYGGIVILGMAVAKNIPSVKDGINHRKVEKERNIQDQIRDVLDNNTTMDFSAKISTLLTDYKNKIEVSVSAKRNEQMTKYIQNYTCSKDTDDKLFEIQTNLNHQLGK